MDTLAHHLVSALFNGAYQGLLLTAVVGATLLLCRRTNAATRHAIGLTALAMVAALPLVHFILLTMPVPWTQADAPSRNPSAPTTSDTGDWTPAELRSHPAEWPEPRDPADVRDHPEALRADIADDVIPDAPVPGAVPDAELLSASAGLGLRPSAMDPTRVIRNAADPPKEPDWMTRAQAWLTAAPGRWEPAFPGGMGLALGCAWAGIALFRLGQLMRQYLGLRRLLGRGVAPPELVLRLFKTLPAAAGVRADTRLIAVADISVPMVAGYWRPAVLLPAALARNARPAELEHVLRHELAHIQRHDTWANLFQQCVRALLFFHPAVWWWSRRLAIDREIACDDHVLAATRAPREYALFLTEFAGQVRGHRWLAAPAGWNTHSQLKERIAMLLDSTRNTSTTIAHTHLGSLTAATLLTAAAALWAGPRLALAGEPHTEAASEASAAEALELTAPAAVNASVHIAPALTPAEVHVDTTSPQVVMTPDHGPRLKVDSPSGSAVVWVTPPAVPAPHPTPEPPRAISRVAPAPQPAPRAVTIAPVAALPPTPRLLAQNQPNRPPNSLERRLERLEHLVESLLEADGLPRHKDAPGVPAAPEVMAPPPVPASLPPTPPPPAIQREELQRIQEKAAAEAQRAMAAVERQRQQSHARTESQNLRRKTLEAQQSALERQVRDLERQLERLEQQRDKLEAQREQLDEQESALEAASEDCETQETRER